MRQTAWGERFTIRAKLVVLVGLSTLAGLVPGVLVLWTAGAERTGVPGEVLVTSTALFLAAMIPVAVSLRRGVIAAVSDTAAVHKELADGDLTARMEVQSRGQIWTLAQSVNAFARMLHDTIRRVREGASDVAGASAQVTSA